MGYTAPIVGARVWFQLYGKGSLRMNQMFARFSTYSHRGVLIGGCSVAALACILGGCGATPVDPTPSGFVEGNRDTSLSSPLGKTSGEPNDTFASPIVAVFDASGVARLQGVVSQTGDLDVYLLGSLERGDRVVADVDTTQLGSPLDASLALFDGQQLLVSNNDDRTTIDLDSLMDVVLRHRSDQYYLVVSHSSFAPGGRFSGSYFVDVEVQSGFAVPEPAAQFLLLDFDGGSVDSPGLGSTSILPFSASAISPAYAGQDEALKEGIRRTMEQNFQRFNVVVATTDDAPAMAGVVQSTIFFGGFDSEAFGIAENIDLYNADFCDDAIIYAESFSPAIFTGTPPAESLAVAIGNVATHEAGHLLGLNHVSDDDAVMDDRSDADAFLLDQEFIRAPLSPDVMDIGQQDAGSLLSETVGDR